MGWGFKSLPRSHPSIFTKTRRYRRVLFLALPRLMARGRIPHHEASSALFAGLALLIAYFGLATTNMDGTAT